jgi:hypothetical protein
MDVTSTCAGHIHKKTQSVRDTLVFFLQPPQLFTAQHVYITKQVMLGLGEKGQGNCYFG